MRLRIFLFSIFLTYSLHTTVFAIVATKSIVVKFDEQPNQKLYLDGQQGRISIIANSEIDTGIVIEAIYTSDFIEMSDTIDFYKNVVVDVFEENGILNGITTIKNNYETNNKYSIDFIVKIPSTIPVIINHTLGDINITGVGANKSITLEYGNLTINNLFEIKSSTDSLFLNYASLNCNKLNNSYISSQFSSLKIDNISQLKLRASFTSAQIDRISKGDIRIDTSSIQINSITDLAITSNESPVKIDEVSGVIQSDMTGGTFTVGTNSTKYNQLNFFSENSAIEIQVSRSLSTYINIDATLTTVEIPQTGNIKTIKDLDNIQFSGYIGNDAGTTRAITAVTKGGRFAIIQQ